MVLDFLWIVLGLLAAGALGSLVAWALLRGRRREEDAVLAGLRAQVEILAQGQATLQQALTAIQGGLGDLQARLVETGAGIKSDLTRDLQEARRELQESA